MITPELRYSLMPMIELERLSRLGDPMAQDEIEHRCMKFAKLSAHTCKREGLTKDQFMKDI